MRFIFAITCPLTYHLSQTLHLYAISAFKISSCYCIKVVKEEKACPAYMKNTFFSPVLFLCMFFVEITLSLNKPGTTSYGLSSFSCVLAKYVAKCAT